MRVRVLLFVVGLVLAGCGDDQRDYSEQEVISALHLSSTDGGITYKTPSGCEAAVVLDSSEEVDLYGGAGDSLVTNPDGTVGVKVSSDLSAACRAEMEKALAGL